MIFEEAYEGWKRRRLTQEEVSKLLGVCERTFRRYAIRYEDKGMPTNSRDTILISMGLLNIAMQQ